ncbi:hypothetical protein [Enterobacter sp. DE0047]|uniref:hypothetical protein n=1 Tax=Enterobacter sp. DE0047 TaxID=2584949 RepID=UPI00336C0E0D
MARVIHFASIFISMITTLDNSAVGKRIHYTRCAYRDKVAIVMPIGTENSPSVSECPYCAIDLNNTTALWGPEVTRISGIFNDAIVGQCSHFYVLTDV